MNTLLRGSWQLVPEVQVQSVGGGGIGMIGGGGGGKMEQGGGTGGGIGSHGSGMIGSGMTRVGDTMVGGATTSGTSCSQTLMSGTSMQGSVVGGGGTQGSSMVGMRHAGGEMVPGCCTQTCELTSKLGSQQRLLSPEQVVLPPVQVVQVEQPQSQAVTVARRSPRMSNPKMIFFMKIIYSLAENLPN